MEIVSLGVMCEADQIVHVSFICKSDAVLVADSRSDLRARFVMLDMKMIGEVIEVDSKCKVFVGIHIDVQNES